MIKATSNRLRDDALLRDKISEEIIQMIGSEGLQPGDKLLSEKKLAEMFRANHQTVRIALKKLQDQGLIERRSGSGTYICETPSSNGKNLVGLLMRTEGHIYADLTQDICSELQKIDKIPVILAMEELEEPARFEKRLQEILELGCHQMIIQHGMKPMVRERLVKHLSRVDKIIWVLNADQLLPGIPGDMVGIDRESAIFQIVDHLTSLGHQRFAYLSHGGNQKYQEEFRHSMQPVYDCLKEALRQKGISIPFEKILFNLNEKHNQGLVEKVFSKADPPTAIIGSADYRVVQVIDIIKEKGLKVPKNLAFVGFNNTPWAHAYDLTSVAFDNQEIIQEVFRQLEAPASSSRHQVLIKPELIIRKSTTTKSLN